MRSSKYLYFCFCFCALQIQAQIIPSSNKVDWSKAGYQVIAQPPTLSANIMNFGARADGITDDSQALVNAIASFNGHYGKVVIPAGTYLIQSEISLPDSVIIQGAGSNSTFIKSSTTGTCFGIYGTTTGNFTGITDGYTKDSEQITVTDASSFAVGDYIEIRQDNGTWDTKPAGWAVKVVGQITKITTVNGNVLTLEDKLRISFSPALNLEVQKINPKKQVRIENLNIERTTNSTDATGNNFAFSYAVNCKVEGVECNKSYGSHCKINASSHIEITGCYFHDAYTYDGSGTKGYGIALDTHAGLCLITNNIFKHLRHAMMVKAGANGNVFGYNYSTNVYRNGSGETPQDNGGDISIHGHYAFANLFEGNIVQNLQIDEYWGPAGPYNTFFRNRTENYGIYMDASNTNYSNFVGNEVLFNLLASLGGVSYVITGTGNILHGNNRNGSISPAGTTTLSDLSYYLNAQPSFWNITDSWPSIGIPKTINTGTIPAKARYLANNYTVITSVANPIDEQKNASISISPNPVKDKIILKLPINEPSTINISLNNLQGKTIRTWNRSNYNNSTLELDAINLTKGVYIINVKINETTYSQKIILATK